MSFDWWTGKQNLVYTHSGVLFSLKKEILHYTITWMKLEDIMISEISQSQRQVLYDPTYMRDAWRDWGQEEKGKTEDEMGGWHHRLNGHEFEWTPGVGDGQGGLVCCDSWGRKELDTTERLNWTSQNHKDWKCNGSYKKMGEKSMGNYYLIGIEFQFYKIKRVMGIAEVTVAQQCECILYTELYI